MSITQHEQSGSMDGVLSAEITFRLIFDPSSVNDYDLGCLQ